ncbi:hypothetical protein POTOM_009866 [Populus tomentosa]|uniref:Uncharacterized protein n=1 Tax=Populus tomentosa TaxID=118781 RepID=A0A8X8ANM9_POPTO|nr:hypothetical protein POTOM_009866 [Populus tomentosa]
MEEQTSGGKLIVAFNMMTPYILMVCVHLGSAGYVLVVHRNGVAALVLAPLALILEMSLNSTGIVASGIASYVQGHVMKTRGPNVKRALHGSIIGGIRIANGLYSVVWGKCKGYTRPELSTTKGKSDLELPDIATTGAAPGDFFRVPD